MSESLIAAIITGVLSLVGVIIANNSNRKLIVYRIDQLEKKVDQHNHLNERCEALEKKMVATETDMKYIKTQLGGN